MAVPFKNHWLPATVLDVNVGDPVLAFVTVMVGLAGLMQKLLSTGVAALKFVLPICVAVMVARPADTKVTWLPEIVILLDVDE